MSERVGMGARGRSDWDQKRGSEGWEEGGDGRGWLEGWGAGHVCGCEGKKMGVWAEFLGRWWQDKVGRCMACANLLDGRC